MLVNGVDGVGQRRIGRRGQNIGVCAGGNNIWRRPPPAPSVWKVWIVRPPMAAGVSSTNPDSLKVYRCAAQPERPFRRLRSARS